MKKYLLLLLIVIITLSMANLTAAQQPVDLVLGAKVTVSNSPPEIQFQWQSLAESPALKIYRKSISDIRWGSSTTIEAGILSYTDSEVQKGIPYEYRILVTSNPRKYDYILSGIELRTVHNRGKLLLLVDSHYSNALAIELEQLTEDLVGDGWTVLREDIDRDMPVPDLKYLMQDYYFDDPDNLKSIYLLGHIPVPYSGNIVPDGHSNNHHGAWPADVYYADIGGAYTDDRINNTTAIARVQNIPGDGKFDASTVVNQALLQVGRVDMYNLPAFELDDTELLRRYLRKAHAFKHKINDPPSRALIDDNFGYFSGESFATSGWRNFSALVGLDNTVTGDFVTDMSAEPYLWGFGCGGGSFSSCGGIGNTGSFVANSVKSVFNMLFGSYFGDWDSQNNILRAPLAADGWCLTNSWSGRPYWMYHHMAMGMPIGYSTMVTQNNSSTYQAKNFPRYVHIALMGDPTLRMHIVAPPSQLVALGFENVTSVQLEWEAADDEVLGYHIYRAKSIDDKFHLLNYEYLADTKYYDPVVASGDHVYMVRAVKLENSNTGTYYNLSQGIFASAYVSPMGIAAKDFFVDFQVTPNLVEDVAGLNFEIAGETEVDITVFDLAGRVVNQDKDLAISKLENKVDLDVSALAAGVYYVKASCDKIERTKRLIVIN